MPGRTFRHLTNKFWDLWPWLLWSVTRSTTWRWMASWLGRDVVIMIACTEARDRLASEARTRRRGRRSWRA